MQSPSLQETSFFPSVQSIAILHDKAFSRVQSSNTVSSESEKILLPFTPSQARGVFEFEEIWKKSCPVLRGREWINPAFLTPDVNTRFIEIGISQEVTSLFYGKTPEDIQNSSLGKDLGEVLTQSPVKISYALELQDGRMKDLLTNKPSISMERSRFRVTSIQEVSYCQTQLCEIVKFGESHAGGNYPLGRSIYFHIPERGTVVVSALGGGSVNLMDYSVHGKCTVIAHIARKTASTVGAVLKKLKDFKRRFSNWKRDSDINSSRPFSPASGTSSFIKQSESNQNSYVRNNSKRTPHSSVQSSMIANTTMRRSKDRLSSARKQQQQQHKQKEGSRVTRGGQLTQEERRVIDERMRKLEELREEKKKKRQSKQRDQHMRQPTPKLKTKQTTISLSNNRSPRQIISPSGRVAKPVGQRVPFKLTERIENKEYPMDKLVKRQILEVRKSVKRVVKLAVDRNQQTKPINSGNRVSNRVLTPIDSVYETEESKTAGPAHSPDGASLRNTAKTKHHSKFKTTLSLHSSEIMSEGPITPVSPNSLPHEGIREVKQIGFVMRGEEMRPGLKKREANQDSLKKVKESGCRKSRTFRSIGDLNSNDKSDAVADEFDKDSQRRESSPHRVHSTKEKRISLNYVVSPKVELALEPSHVHVSSRVVSPKIGADCHRARALDSNIQKLITIFNERERSKSGELKLSGSLNLSGNQSPKDGETPLISPRGSFVQQGVHTRQKRSLIANVYQTLRLKKLSLESPPQSSGFISAQSSGLGSPRKGRHSEISPLDLSRKIRNIRLRSLSEVRERIKSQKRDSQSPHQSNQDIRKKVSELLDSHRFQKRKQQLRNPVPLVRKTSLATSRAGGAFSPRVNLSRLSEENVAPWSKEKMKKKVSRNKLVTIDLFGEAQISMRPNSAGLKQSQI